MRTGALVLSILCSGCAATLASVEPVRFQGQEVLYKSGTPIVMSRGAASDVVIAPKTGPTGRYKVEQRIFFMVSARNRGPARIEISEANFSATANGSPARIVKAVEIEDAVLSDAAWAQSRNAFAAGAATLQASDAGTTTFSGQVGNMSFAGNSYNSGQAAQAQRQVAAGAAANSEAIRAREQTQLGQVATLLQRTTVGAGEGVSGVVVIEPTRHTRCDDVRQGMVVQTRPCSLRIQVRIGLDTHTIGFDESFSGSN